MEKVDIKNLSKRELEDAIAGIGGEKYRARQVFHRLYRTGVKSFNEMTDIPLALRAKLKEKFYITRPILLDSRRSLSDGTTKYLLKLEDGNTIETVFLPESKRSTICLSSQAGCKFACAFCASALFGFSRDLAVSEILNEVLFVREANPDSPITNLVFMGIGEPFDNYDNVMRAIRILNDKDAFNIGARKMTISTCGLIPGIERLKSEGLQVELSISLHSADDKGRSQLVPINKKYPTKDLMAACRDYIKDTNRVITFEYILLKGMNSGKDDALKLARLLKGIKCKVNAITYNLIKAKDYRVPDERDINLFIKTLEDNGTNITRRRSRGEDIDAGCGQLRISRM